jgi:hypothetical protein
VGALEVSVSFSETALNEAECGVRERQGQVLIIMEVRNKPFSRGAGTQHLILVTQPRTPLSEMKERVEPESRDIRPIDVRDPITKLREIRRGAPE